MSEEPSGETTKQRILRIAAELFAEKGYSATGVAELSAATGLGKGALYHHIGSKEDLLFQISKRHIEEALDDGEAVLELDVSPEEKLRLLGRLQMRAISGHLAEVTLYFREGNALTGKRRKHVDRIRERWETVWRKVLEEGVEAGAFRAADPIAVKGVLGVFNYSWVWFHPDGDLTSDEVADRLIDLVIRGQLVDTRLPAGSAPAADG